MISPKKYSARYLGLLHPTFRHSAVHATDSTRHSAAGWQPPTPHHTSARVPVLPWHRRDHVLSGGGDPRAIHVLGGGGGGCGEGGGGDGGGGLGGGGLRGGGATAGAGGWRRQGRGWAVAVRAEATRAAVGTDARETAATAATTEAWGRAGPMAGACPDGGGVPDGRAAGRLTSAALGGGGEPLDCVPPPPHAAVRAQVCRTRRRRALLLAVFPLTRRDQEGGTWLYL